jgi:phosphonate degradation associated HDIG domain protein
MPGIHDDLLAIYGGRATRRYGLAEINQLQHALQAAALAEQAGETPSLIAAALLHDVGHMIHGLGDDPASRGIDDRHEEQGASWLAERFPESVSEPVRLHVPAKRYLCAAEPGYCARLSPDSRRSLQLQGGPMSADEMREFARQPFATDAVRLRRYDEAAKDPRASTPGFEHYLSYVAACLRPAPGTPPRPADRPIP